MKKHSLFMPKRQLYMAGNGPEGGQKEQPEQKEGQKQQGEYTPGDAKKDAARVLTAGQQFLDQAEQLENKQDFDKPMTDAEMKEKSKGYPKEPITGANQAIVDELRGRIAKEVKDKNIDNPNLHRGTASMVDTDKTKNYEYVLVIDATVKPPNGPNLLFKSPKPIEPPKEAIDVDDAVGGLLKPYDELPANNNEYKTTLNQLRSKVKNHGDAEMTGIEKDGVKTGWVLLKDENAKDKNGYRVFKGTPV